MNNIYDDDIGYISQSLITPLFPDVESNPITIDSEENNISEKGPEPGMDSFVVSGLIDLIKDENEAIQGYVSFKETIAKSNPEFIKLIDDITSEEMNHVGMLEEMMKTLSPNTENIELGKEEAKDDLQESLENTKSTNNDFEVDIYSIDEDLQDKDVIDTINVSFNKVKLKYGDIAVKDLNAITQEDIINNKGIPSNWEFGRLVSSIAGDIYYKKTKSLEYYSTADLIRVNNIDLFKTRSEKDSEGIRNLSKLLGKKLLPNRLSEGKLEQNESPADIADSIAKYVGHKVWCDLSDYDEGPMDNLYKISFTVDGDWRHDHQKFDELVNDWAEENNKIIYRINQREIGESDSDSYKAYHDVWICNNKEQCDKLNDMSKLFTEGVTENKMKKKLTEASNESPYFKAFVTNLGKYNEGDLIGKWVDFPIDEDEFNDVLESIGISDEPDEDGNIYEEWFVTDYETNLDAFDWQELGEYPSYEQLNDFGEQIESINDIEEVNNAVEAVGTLEDALEGLANGDIIFYKGIYGAGDLASYIIDEMYGDDIPKELVEQFLDYDALGRDVRTEYYAEDDDEPETAGEYWCGDENATDAEIGEEVVNQLGTEGISNIDYYFDFDAYGNDLIASGQFTETSGGFVETV